MNELLNEVEAKGSVDYVAEYAFKLPAYVIMQLLGVPRHMYKEFKVWSLDMTDLLGAPQPSLELMDRALEALNNMNAAFKELIAVRRAEPQDDMLTALVHATDEDDRLSEDELLTTCQVIMLAGHETTIHGLGNGLKELIQHRDSWEQLRDDPKIVKSAVEELLRFNSVAGSLVRTVLEDFEWHGKHIKKGDVVFLMVAAANRDPRVYNDPESLILDRDNPYPLSFGPGIHFCLGSQLARMELEKTFAAIVNRFDQAEILDNQFEWSNSVIVRGMKKLNVKFHPKAEWHPQQVAE